jgi:hypothetical protein
MNFMNFINISRNSIQIWILKFGDFFKKTKRNRDKSIVHVTSKPDMRWWIWFVETRSRERVRYPTQPRTRCSWSRRSRRWPALTLADGEVVLWAVSHGDERLRDAVGEEAVGRGDECFDGLVASDRVTKTGWIFQNLVKTGGIGPVRIPKPPNLLFTVSKFQKKIKVSKKYVKKLDQILSLLVKNFL